MECEPSRLRRALRSLPETGVSESKPPCGSATTTVAASLATDNRSTDSISDAALLAFAIPLITAFATALDAPAGSRL